MAPDIVAKSFSLRPQGQHNPKNWSDFTLPIVRTVKYGMESVRYLRPKILESIPANTRKVDTIECFKPDIKNGNLNLVCVDFKINRIHVALMKNIYQFYMFYLENCFLFLNIYIRN